MQHIYSMSKGLTKKIANVDMSGFESQLFTYAPCLVYNTYAPCLVYNTYAPCLVYNTRKLGLFSMAYKSHCKLSSYMSGMFMHTPITVILTCFRDKARENVTELLPTGLSLFLSSFL